MKILIIRRSIIVILCVCLSSLRHYITSANKLCDAVKVHIQLNPFVWIKTSCENNYTLVCVKSSIYILILREWSFDYLPRECDDLSSLSDSCTNIIRSCWPSNKRFEVFFHLYHPRVFQPPMFCSRSLMNSDRDEQTPRFLRYII